MKENRVAPGEGGPAYRRRRLRMTGILLGIWFIVTFVTYFARDLDFSVFGWPFGFWMAAQGSLLMYVAIVWFYARYMEKLDAEFGVGADE